MASFQRGIEGVSHNHMGECLLLLFGAMFLELPLGELKDLWSKALSIDGNKHPNPGLALEQIVSVFVRDPKRFGAVVLPPRLRWAIVPILHEFLMSRSGDELPPLCKYIIVSPSCSSTWSQYDSDDGCHR